MLRPAARPYALAACLFGTALMTSAASAAPANTDLAAIGDQLAAQHEANVQRLRDWIALPTIAAEGLNTQEGADYQARLLREAGFQHVEVIPTAGKPGVFATLDAGAMNVSVRGM